MIISKDSKLTRTETHKQPYKATAFCICDAVQALFGTITRLLGKFSNMFNADSVASCEGFS